jgi:limonene-1,2-epoxide hydrolase
MPSEVETVEKFVDALRHRDLQAATQLYEPNAVWEVHVPGGDGEQVGHEQIADLMDPWFTARDGFEIAGYRVISDGGLAALRWELHWRDEHHGAPCISHQSHFFEIAEDRIRRHWMYCSGVHVLAPVDAHGHEHVHQAAES